MIAARLSGERFFSVRYCNLDPVPRKLVLGGKGNLLPIKMDGREVMCRRGVYVASSRRIDIGIGLSLNRIIGGTSGFLQTLRGEGTVFLECIGAPIELDLAAGQTIEADENHLVATQGIPEQNIRPEWSLKNFFGGEGLSLLHITGPGKVYLNP